MKKKNIILFAVAALAAASCAKVENLDRMGNDEITFHVARCLTRTVVPAVRFDISETFGMYAWSDAMLDSLLYMDNEKIAYSEGCWKPSRPYFWPRLALVDFEAVYPYDATKSVPEVYADSLVYRNFVVDGTVDLMYSTKAVGYRGNVDEVTDAPAGGVDSGFSGVPVLFHHALAKISVDIYASNLENEEGVFSWEVFVNEVRLAGAATRGSLKLKLPQTDTLGLIPWTLPKGRIWTSDGTVDTLALNGATGQLFEDKPLEAAVDQYVLPQALSEQVFEVDVTLKTYKNGVLFMTESGTLEAPILTTAVPAWKINSAIQYKLTIVPCATGADDAPASITFDTAESAWERLRSTDQWGNDCYYENVYDYEFND